MNDKGTESLGFGPFFSLFNCQHIINLDVEILVRDELTVYGDVLFSNWNKQNSSS